MSSEENIYDTIERLADVLLPDRIGFSDIKHHLNGYNKAKAVQDVVRGARADPLMTKLKLHIVYAELQKLFNNGGLK